MVEGKRFEVKNPFAEVVFVPSPFPGMDPYLEAPEIWVDFHGRLAEGISSDLNRKLPARYICLLYTSDAADE